MQPDIKVLARPELISRAFSNIIRNGVYYAGNAGQITISGRKKDNQLIEIIVSDEGTGVPEDQIEKIFDPLYRVQTDRSRESGGTGLGLAIVKTCVETCGGKVFARNRLPQGLEVIILLSAQKG